jgi:hypothetical protein
MMFESKRGPKRKTMCFVSWKAYFSSCYFFITPFPFLKLEVAVIKILITQNETHMMKI